VRFGRTVNVTTCPLEYADPAPVGEMPARTTVTVPAGGVPGVIAVICITSTVDALNVYGPVPVVVAVEAHKVGFGDTQTPLFTESPVIFASGIEVAAAETLLVIVVGATPESC
jgi:hypothetical protein